MVPASAQPERTPPKAAPEGVPVALALGATAPENDTSALPTRAERELICRGMASALDEEHRAAGDGVIHLDLGSRMRVTGEASIYKFGCAEHLDVSPGDPVVVRLANEDVESIVIGVSQGALHVALQRDVGETVMPGAEVLLGANWLLTRLRDRVRDAFEVGPGSSQRFNLTNALRTIGVGPIAVAPSGLEPRYENERLPLNEAQMRAIETAFRAPVSVIASPAGTGKTLTLGALVEACYRAGLRTLVVAPSNVAVDLQMMQLCARLAGEPGFDAAEVLRIGNTVGSALVSKYGPNVVLGEVIARRRPELQVELDRAKRALDDVAVELTTAQCGPSDSNSGLIGALRKRLEDERSALWKTRTAVREYGRELTGAARVVGATLARTYLDPSLREFDVVVIDEASMAQTPAVFVAAGLARKHVVIAGDPYQLAAPVRSKGQHRDWLTADIFARLEIIQAIRREEDLPYLTQLTEQRRSAEGICALQRELWYGPALRTAREVYHRERQRENKIFGTSALCFVNTSSLRPEAYHPWGRTLANDEHAEFIADLVAYIDSAGELPAAGATTTEILALSQYRGQVRNIRRRLGQQYHGRGVAVSTVHRAQGAEATTCVFDMTDTRHTLSAGSEKTRATNPYDDFSRLLAVAVSRARSRFVFVADLDFLERSAIRRSVLRRLCSHLREHGYEIPVREIQPNHARASLQLLR